MYVRVAQSVEDVTADHRLFYLEGVAGSSPTVYFYFFNIFCFVSCFYCLFFFSLLLLLFCLMYFIIFILFI